MGGREVEKRKEVGSLGEPYLHVATRLREKEKLGRRVIQMYNNGFCRDEGSLESRFTVTSSYAGS